MYRNRKTAKKQKNTCYESKIKKNEKEDEEIISIKYPLDKEISYILKTKLYKGNILTYF